MKGIKILSASLAASFLLSLTACTAGSNSSGGQSSVNSPSTAVPGGSVSTTSTTVGQPQAAGKVTIRDVEYDVAKTTDLNLNFQNKKGLTNEELAQIGKLVNLKSLVIIHAEISDITPIGNLTNLETLILTSNRIADLTPIAKLTKLKDLGLADNQVSDLKPLANLTNLTSLRMDWNPNLGSSEKEWLQEQLPSCKMIFD